MARTRSAIDNNISREEEINKQTYRTLRKTMKVSSKAHLDSFWRLKFCTIQMNCSKTNVVRNYLKCRWNVIVACVRWSHWSNRSSSILSPTVKFIYCHKINVKILKKKTSHKSTHVQNYKRSFRIDYHQTYNYCIRRW